jgi:putative acetyltransferase
MALRGIPRIRDEAPADRDDIHAVHSAAFGRAAEADLVDALRRDGTAIVSLVATAVGRVVGHVLFSALRVERPGGTVRAAALAPLAVRPEWQRRGIGAALVDQGVARCRERGCAGIIVVGDAAYYGRFGFAAACVAGLLSPYAGPAFLGLEFESGVFARSPGTVHYSEPFAGVD